MPDLPLTLAIGDYLHTRELANGRIKPEGIRLTVLNHPFETIAYRFLASYEWELSEFSLATYCTLVAEGDAPMIGLPVFPSRVFRHGAIFVTANSPIKSAADLAGKRIGIPQWTQTAVTYVRGWLQHDAGVPLTSIDWVQAGVNDAGRKEMAKFTLPAGFRLTSRPDKSLGELLLDGDDRRDDLGAAAQRVPRRQARRQTADPRLPRAGAATISARAASFRSCMSW